MQTVLQARQCRIPLDLLTHQMPERRVQRRILRPVDHGTIHVASGVLQLPHGTRLGWIDVVVGAEVGVVGIRFVDVEGSGVDEVGAEGRVDVGEGCE